MTIQSNKTAYAIPGVLVEIAWQYVIILLVISVIIALAPTLRAARIPPLEVLRAVAVTEQF